MRPCPSLPNGQSEEILDILYRIVHDFQAPIRGMTEMARILAEDHGAQLDEQGREYLELLVECGGKTQQMLSGLVSYVRIGREAKISDTVDCNLLFARCLGKIKSQAEAKGVSITHGSLPVIAANATQIETLFSNLLDNALKFCNAKTKVEISLSAERAANDYWQFCLGDNGMGIEEQDRERIFEVFQRLHPGDDYPGIGMGLAIAKQIVYNHDGLIWCAANTPQGTCFYFTLPPVEEI